MTAIDTFYNKEVTWEIIAIFLQSLGNSEEKTLPCVLYAWIKFSVGMKPDTT